MKRFAIFILFIVLLFPVLIQAQTYPEVWFENSNYIIHLETMEVGWPIFLIHEIRVIR